jgi:hypothetical protein
VIASCPYADTTRARLAGDSSGRHASKAGHVAVGVLTGAFAGVTGVASVGGNAQAMALTTGGLVAAGVNWAVALRRVPLPARDAQLVADCDPQVRDAYANAYSERARHKRGKGAWLSALISFFVGAAAIIGLIVAFLSSGNFT